MAKACTLYIYILIYISISKGEKERARVEASNNPGQQLDTACNYIILFAAEDWAEEDVDMGLDTGNWEPRTEDTRMFPFHSTLPVCLFLYANEINTTLTRGTNNIIRVARKAM